MLPEAHVGSQQDQCLNQLLAVLVHTPDLVKIEPFGAEIAENCESVSGADFVEPERLVEKKKLAGVKELEIGVEVVIKAYVVVVVGAAVYVAVVHIRSVPQASPTCFRLLHSYSNIYILQGRCVLSNYMTQELSSAYL